MSSFLALLPFSIQKDETVKRLAAILDGELTAIDSDIEKILIYAGLDNQEEAVIDELARSFHMLPDEGYRFAKTIEQKRELVKSALTLHRHKGTLYAVKEVLRILNIKGEILEWFQYGGQPYCFRLDLVIEGMSQKEIALLEAMVNQVKNLRSHIDIFKISLLSRGRYYAGATGTTGELIRIRYYVPESITVPEHIYTGGAGLLGEYIHIKNTI